MFRVATRFFSDGHESTVGNFTVQSGGVAAPRWFELRDTTAGPVTVFQQGTYQPDTTHRWMGSAAMDQQGNIAVGYSASSSSINPQIRYAGRLVSDPLNTLPQAEAHLFDGTGSQTGTNSRWGDYSDMTIDPVDDCTFWYRQEYYSTTTNFNWRTRIGSFKFPGCGGSPTPTPTPTPTPSPGVNVALAANGGAAVASSTYSAGYPVSSVNNGERSGVGWGAGGGWNDATAGVFPDSVEITFSGAQPINEIDVFTLQDNYSAPSPPTETMTFTQYGITAFDVQYWDGLQWVIVPGAQVTSNNLVWRKFSFGAITTNKIRVLVNNALASYSRITEIEAYVPGPLP